MRTSVVIPAYEPERALAETVSALLELGVTRIVVVDDGSSGDRAGVFKEVDALGAVVQRHAVNLGKGAALKTGLNYALLAWPESVGMVTADADGQHAPEDIAAVARALEKNPDALVMGARQFGKHVPARSLIGNRLTTVLLKALTGIRLTDTQTGLRGIPASFARELLRIPTPGYEFELEMVLAAKHRDMRFLEVPIRTIYLNGNASSHFNPVWDSMLIYFVLMRFAMTSLMTAGIDNGVFWLAYRITGTILGSQALGRSAAVVFNYLTARKAVFHYRARHQEVLPKYLLLVLVNTTVSYLTITFLHSRFGVGVMAAKVSVESLLFFVNFAIQRDFIFRKSGPRKTE